MSPSNTVNSLIFSPGAVIRYGGHLFINVPVILQVDGTPLIETVKNNDISRTTQFSIYNFDGAFLAKVVGTCLFRTREGEKAGLELKFPSRATVCLLGDQVLFEVRRVAAAAIEITAELFSPTGMCVKTSPAIPFATYAKDGGQIAVATARVERFRNVPVGFSVTDDGRNIGVGGH